MDMYAENFLLLPLCSIFCCSPSKLNDLCIQGFCVMIVSSSNATATLFFSKLLLHACSFPLVLFLHHNPLHAAVPVLIVIRCRCLKLIGIPCSSVRHFANDLRLQVFLR